MLEETLTAAGHEVALSEDGKQGTRQHRAAPAKSIITDIFMPEKDGVEVIMELRFEFPEVAILAMSGRPGGMNFLKLAKQLAAVRTLEKPFRPEELLSAVEEVLSLKSE